MLGVLLGAVLSTSTGCGLFQAVFCYRPCAMRGDCGPALAGGDCDEGCGPTCGPTRRPIGGPACAPRRVQACTECGAACGGECDTASGRPCRRPLARSCGACGDSCGDPCGGGRCWHRGPLSCLFALFMPGTWCGSSCGERYWGDFYSDPPDCWDPCDGHGNYTGNGHVSGGCRSCGGGGNVTSDVFTDDYAGGNRADRNTPVAEGNIISQTDRVVGPAPRPESQPHRAQR
jgi:hypothetical protein